MKSLKEFGSYEKCKLLKSILCRNFANFKQYLNWKWGWSLEIVKNCKEFWNKSNCFFAKATSYIIDFLMLWKPLIKFECYFFILGIQTFIPSEQSIAFLV